MRAIAGVLAVLGAALAPITPTAAQDGGGRIGLTLEGGAMTASGGARVVLDDPDGPVEGEFRQAASGAWAVRADYDLARWRLELGVQYLPAALVLEVSDGTRLGSSGLDAKVTELAPRLGYRLLATTTGGTLRALAGPSVQRWSTSLSDSRVTLAIGADIHLEAPLAERLRLVARGGITRGPSFLGSDDEEEGLVEATSVTRWQGGIGLRWLVGT